MFGEQKNKRPRIVVIGGGFGGAFAVRRLAKRLAADEAEVLLVDRNNFFVFHPFLVEAGNGTLPPQHAVVGLRFADGPRPAPGSPVLPGPRSGVYLPDATRSPGRTTSCPV